MQTSPGLSNKIDAVLRRGETQLENSFLVTERQQKHLPQKSQCKSILFLQLAIIEELPCHSSTLKYTFQMLCICHTSLPVLPPLTRAVIMYNTDVLNNQGLTKEELLELRAFSSCTYQTF